MDEVKIEMEEAKSQVDLMNAPEMEKFKAFMNWFGPVDTLRFKLLSKENRYLVATRDIK